MSIPNYVRSWQPSAVITPSPSPHPFLRIMELGRLHPQTLEPKEFTVKLRILNGLRIQESLTILWYPHPSPLLSCSLESLVWTDFADKQDYPLDSN